MLKIRRAQDRGFYDHGWLQTYHTFSFAKYHDAEQMRFRKLRVINEDIVQPNRGFGMHGHRDMEILTYIVEGTLEHKDSLGNRFQVQTGDFQKMSAATGIRHSESNPSASEPVHMLQIWIYPNQKGLPAAYEDRRSSDFADPSPSVLIASPDGRDQSFQINQDAYLYKVILQTDETFHYPILSNRGLWLQLVKGSIQMESHDVSKGDGVAVEGIQQIELRAKEPAEFLLFDLV